MHLSGTFHQTSDLQVGVLNLNLMTLMAEKADSHGYGDRSSFYGPGIMIPPWRSEPFNDL